MYLGSQCLELGFNAMKILLNLSLLPPYLSLAFFSQTEKGFPTVTEHSL